MVFSGKTNALGYGNYLGPFSEASYRHEGQELDCEAEASDQPESQELGGGAVGGQEGLQEVKF